MERSRFEGKPIYIDELLLILNEIGLIRQIKDSKSIKEWEGTVKDNDVEFINVKKELEDLKKKTK